MRHAADRRLDDALHRVLPGARRRRARCRSTSTAPGAASATTPRSTSPATPPPTLAALLPRLRERTDHTWRARVERWTAAWDDYSVQRAHAHTSALNPELVVRELSDRLPDDALLAVDCGTATSWYARDVTLHGRQYGSLSGTLLSMGGGMPYAIAAKNAHPDRPVVALIGDGAMQMNGVNELITVQRYWQTWSDPRFVVLVLSNDDLSYVSWETRGMLGEAPDPQSQSLPDVPYADWARLLGLGGETLTDRAAIGGTWDRALAADRPFVVDAKVDKDIPLVPPHVTIQQALNTARSQLADGDALVDHRQRREGDRRRQGPLRAGARPEGVICARTGEMVRHGCQG